MEFFAKLVKNSKSFHYFLQKKPTLDVSQGSEYASELVSKVTEDSFLNNLITKGNR